VTADVIPAQAGRSGRAPPHIATWQSPFLVAIEDLVAGCARNPELPAEFRHGFTREPPSHKLQSFIHNGTLSLIEVPAVFSEMLLLAKLILRHRVLA